MALPSTVESNWKSNCPHHARRVSGDRWHRRDAGPLARGHDLDLQALLTPQPVDSLLVDLTALVVAQRSPGTPEPMTGVFGGVGA